MSSQKLPGQRKVVVSPRRATANFMLRTLSTEPVATLAELPHQAGRILEVRISHASRCVGRSVKDLQLPHGCLLVALQHKYQSKVASAEDVILAGDRVVVIVNANQEKELLARLI